MKKYSYNLFPKSLVILGYLLIILAFVIVIISLTSNKSENQFRSFAVSFAVMFIGMIMAAFRSSLIIDTESGCVFKESTLLGMKFSFEKVKIPRNCTGIIIKEIGKIGTGYYRFVIPVSYYFRSFDMFFRSGTGVVRLINTDYKRAIKIAEFIKSVTNLEYQIGKIY
jgi:hypothetical protein